MPKTISLISPGPPDISEFGMRSLSAYMKSKGYRVIKIFLPGGVEHFRHNPEYIYSYDRKIFASIDEILKGTDIVGVSFMSNYLDRALALSKHLRSKGKCLIWGGIHPTVLPVQSLEYADYVICGEGEKAMYNLTESLIKGEYYPGIKNLYYKGRHGDIFYIGQEELIDDINSLPYTDYSTDDSYILNMKKGELEPLTAEIFCNTLMFERPIKHKAAKSFKIYTSRGCPYSCTYCANSTLRALAPSGKYLRFESIDRIIDRLKLILRDFPCIGVINLFDDVFTSRPREEIHEFCQKYRKAIGLPFQIQIAPGNLDEELLIHMLQSGLYYIEMGIQSLSERTQKLYMRNMDINRLKDTINLINSHKKAMNHPCYHIILDNPWETELEKRQTLEFLLDIPKPFWLKTASLVLFPGTKLYIKGKTDGTLYDEEKQIYRKNLITPEINYINFLFFLTGKHFIPAIIVKMLNNSLFIKIFSFSGFNFAIRVLMGIIELSELVFKGIRALVKGDIKRIYSYLKRIR